MEARAPQGPIQRTFLGLLGLVDLKGSELTPNSLQGFTQPVLDVGLFLRAGVRKTIRGDSVHGATSSETFGNFAGAVTVPQGKVWLVESVTVTWNVQPTESLKSLGVMVIPDGPFAPQLLASSHGNWGSPASVEYALVGWNGLIVVRGGGSFGISWSGYTGLGDQTLIRVLASEVNN